MNPVNKVVNTDCLEGLRMLDDRSVQCCVTSPPYYRLRDYGFDGQIGLERTPEEFVCRLVEVFREVKRVLKDDGTLWLNIGDSYCSSASGTAGNASTLGGSKVTQAEAARRPSKRPHGDIKAKDLIGIPWMLAFALRADGWYLRQDIIWAKPNPMPESVTDRCTKAHEYIFLLSKSEKYYYDHEAIKENSVYQPGDRPDRVRGDFKGKFHAHEDIKHISDSFRAIREKRNRRDVWTIATKAYRGAHFAVFPEELVVPCVLAGSRCGDTVLDPFGGSGTTGKVAYELGRNFILLEANPGYCKLADGRLAPVIAQGRMAL